ncbi:MAG: ParA family protein [Gammaproteobacteria bacterium]|nr:ParA family protein [Gammaproteobacteria bacterium]MDE0716070.1 ParA family protein [Gammaproteobacteria bacterium]MXY63815.1 AAA family ATPase [Gammaproteobacteria bacterium]MYG67930.1 AAA family ATPase [Gammaproteobacteria bacterium]
MKRILVVNPKGGCGKSTLATNLASYYATWEVPVALIDLDAQQSSLEWLDQRSGALYPIEGIDGSRGRLSVPGRIQRVVMDAPARTGKNQLQRYFNQADEILIPVLPSPIDIRAAGHFVGELLLEGMLKKSRVGLVANRVRENTLIYSNLERFLRTLKVPLVAHLRDTQNYIRAAEGGRGIFEMAPYLVDRDIETWRPLIKWVEKNRRL